METKDLGSVKAAEDATRKNVQAAIAHGKETREIVERLEKHIEVLERQIATFGNLVNGFNQQLGILQAKVLGGGPTSG